MEENETTWKKRILRRLEFTRGISSFSDILSLFILMINALLLSGCSSVKPWERDILADYTMRSDRDPLENMLAEHMWFSREAASGGMSIGGGGCGCN